MALGQRDLSTLVTLTGWDAAELQKFSLQDGTTYAEVYARLNAALSALNAEISGSWWGGLMSVTDQPDVEYRVGVSNGMQRHTEYGRPDPRRAETEGHMLPLLAWDRYLGWTWDYLRKARMTQIEADIADGIKDVRDNLRQQLLRRLLKRGDDSGTYHGLGSSGYSPGFATAAASTSVDFTPPSYGGTSFDSDHEHYVGIAGGVFTAAVFQDARDELREHGHEPPYDFVIGPSDEDTVKGLTGFTPIAESLVAYGATQDLARLDGTDIGYGTYYIGTIEDFAVRVVRGVPQYYGFGYKSYGRLSQRNPLVVRVEKGNSVLTVRAFPDPNAGSPMAPIQNLMLFAEYGVGIRDRTNGTARYVNNSTWSDGTPT
jgi:hypothetical protein